MGQTWAYASDELMGQDFIDEIKTTALSTGLPAEKLVVSGLIAKSPVP